MEDMEPSQQLKLTVKITEFLRNLKTPRQRAADLLGIPSRKHKRQAQGRLQFHLAPRSPGRLVQHRYRLLSPAMTFGQQRHFQEQTDRSGCECDTHCSIARLRKSPFQSRANVAQMHRGGVRPLNL